MIKVLLFHDSAFEFTIFSADIVEVDASIEAAAIDTETGGLEDYAVFMVSCSLTV